MRALVAGHTSQIEDALRLGGTHHRAMTSRPHCRQSSLIAGHEGSRLTDLVKED